MEACDDTETNQPRHRSYSESGSDVIKNTKAKKDTVSKSKMPLSLSILKSGSTSDLSQSSAGGRNNRRRRFSLTGFFSGKSTMSLNNEGIEELEENENDASLSSHSKKLLISFADIYGGVNGECHDNVLFKSERDELEQNVAFFGKKGRAEGEYQDAKDICVLSGNRLLITDYVNSRLQLCSTSGRLLLTYSGTDVTEPWGASCIDNKCVALTSRKNKCVQVLDLDGEITSTFGESFFTCPTGLAVDDEGNFIVCDSGANTVSLHDKDGHFVRYIGDPNTPAGTFSMPRYVCISQDEIIISDSGNHQIKVFSKDGKHIRTFGSFGNGECQFKSPYCVCTNKGGDIFVADHYNNRISLYTSTGVFKRHLVTGEQGLRRPQGLALKSGNTLFVTHGDLKASEILVYKMDSLFISDNDDIMICHL